MLKSKVRKPLRRVTNVDLIIGERLHAARRAAGLSQQDLGEALGVSFQQIQKYEKGKNRLSGSRLIRVAEVLTIDAGQLLGSLPTSHGGRGGNGLLVTKDGRTLAALFNAMDDRARAKLLEAARSISREAAETVIRTAEGPTTRPK